MPYIPPANRPAIDSAVNDLANEIAAVMTQAEETAEISVRLRAAFRVIARTIRAVESGETPADDGKAADLAARVLDTAAGYGLKGGWTGELNYALTRLIQAVPLAMNRNGTWSEALRYWMYAQIVGALSRAAWEVHAEGNDDFIDNGLCGVFIDVKDEYKRRVNTAYEAAQILKSGDCYDLAPYRTHLVPVTVDNVTGYQEVMLPKQDAG